MSDPQRAPDPDMPPGDPTAEALPPTEVVHDVPSEVLPEPSAAVTPVAAPAEPALPERPGAEAAPAEPAPPEPSAAGVPAEPGSPPVSARRAGPVVPVASAIARMLAAAGTRIAFTVPGESFLPLLSALPDAGIRVVAARHEGAAAFMAEAATQLTGAPQLALVTRTVGAANAAIGIHTAHQDSAPMVTIAGDVRSAHRGREAFQESDLAGGIGLLAGMRAAPRTPREVVALLDRYLRGLGHGRPLPLFLAIAEDLFPLPVGEPRAVTRSGAPAPDPAAVRAVLHLLAGSERGAILAGGGVLRARTSKRLLALAEALGVPVIAAWRRPDVVPNDHPLFLGMSGYWAPPTVRSRLLDADALLVLGSRLSEPASHGWRIPGRATRWAHVDLAPRRAHAGLPAPEIAIAADAGRFVEAALSLLRAGALEAAPRERRLAAARADRAAWEAAVRVDAGDWDGPGLHPGRALATIAAHVPPATIVTTDAGNFAGWVARTWRFPRPGSFVGPTSGAMGYALPAAIAASLLHPDRPVIAFAGDGGFAMTMAELETAVRTGARPIVVVLDNERYGTIRMHQDRGGLTPVGSDLGPIDAAGIAIACGALGYRVRTEDALLPALTEALAARRPAVIQLAVDPRWVSVDDRP
ncbi:MAG: thiamine pyrophosphate-binding protein [Chloroflexota bacterium]